MAFAVAVGTSITHDLHMKVLRRIGVTFRTARDNTWLDIFSDQERYIEVNFTDGRRLFGWPLYYSNHPEEGLLYVYDAAWIDDEGKYAVTTRSAALGRADQGSEWPSPTLRE